MNFTNDSSFAPKTAAEEKKQAWHRLDCLTANKLKIESDKKKIMQWFEQQDSEWQEARVSKLMMRLRTRKTNY